MQWNSSKATPCYGHKAQGWLQGQAERGKHRTRPPAPRDSSKAKALAGQRCHNNSYSSQRTSHSFLFCFVLLRGEANSS